MAIAVNGSEVKFMYGASDATTEIPELKEMPGAKNRLFHLYDCG